MARPGGSRGIAAPHATSALSYDFGLPGQPGYEANQAIQGQFGETGGQNAPVLLVVTDRGRPVPASAAPRVAALVTGAVPGARVATWADHPQLRSADGRLAVVMVYPRAVPGPDAYAHALPALQAVASRAPLPVVVTGEDALADQGGGGGASVLAETLLGGVGALVVLVIVFGSFLALTPLIVAAGSILATFLVL
jgi:RND superfamily putative drug exporter